MDQRAFVAEFLARTFAPDPVPPVELSRDNVAALFLVAQRNVLLNQIVAEERNDSRARAEEYAAETERLHELLDGCVSLESLSGAGRACVRSLAQAVVALRVADSQHLYAGVLALQDRKTALEAEKARLAQLRSSLDIEAVRQQRSALAAATAAMKQETTAKATETQKQQQQLSYYEKASSKTVEYAASLAVCEAHLQQVGFDPALRHSELVAQFEALKLAEQECAAPAAELLRFGNLEPHVERAQARLDAARATLANLRTQYNAELAKLASVADK